MAYTFDNRVKFVVRYMYDIDNNGYLDKNDFECLALRNTVIEGRGNWDDAAFKNNKKVMLNLWNEIAELADFNKDGQVTVDEFKEGIQKTCTGKSYADFPGAFKTFIGNMFKTIDVNVLDRSQDGQVSAEEFKTAIMQTFRSKSYQDFPPQFKIFISKQFATVDVNGDGLVGVDEYRLDCVTRSAFNDIVDIDDAYNRLLSDEDKKAGGINLDRYQELYAQFISNPDEKCSAVYLFGPLQVV